MMKYTRIVKEDIDNIIDFCNHNFLIEKLKNKSILITGASGMIGSYFVYTMLRLNELYNTDIKIICLLRNKNKLDKSLLNNSNVIILEQDICLPIIYDDDVNYVVHAASPASPKIMRDKPVETNFANTIGTANTLIFSKTKKVDGYLFISSREIYGEPNLGQDMFTEDGLLGQVNPLIPRNGYAEGKKAAENMCVAFKEEYGINTKIARLAHTYGPGMSIYDGRVQADFLNDVYHNRNIIMKSDGPSIRTYTYISDAIKALLLILLKSNEIVYNVSDENSMISIKKLAQTILEIHPEKKLQLIMDIPNEVDKGASSFKTGILSSEKIRKELNWYPIYNIKEGFKRTLEHIELEESK